MVGRIGTAFTQEKLKFFIERNSAEFATTQQQISSGKRDLRYSGYNDLVPRQVSLSAESRELEKYIESSTFAANRLDVVDGSIGSIFDALDRMKSEVSQAMSANTFNDGQVTLLAENAIELIGSVLNTNHNGVYIFGGIDDDTPPVDLSDPAVLNELDPNAPIPVRPRYYTGSLEQSRVQIADNKVIDYGPTAGDQTFRLAFEALQVVATSGGDLDTLRDGFDKLSTSLSEVAELRGQSGARMRYIEDVQFRHSELRLTVNNTLLNIEEVDIGQATIDLAKYQNMLQASYITVNRVSDLNLLKYIN